MGAKSFDEDTEVVGSVPWVSCRHVKKVWQPLLADNDNRELFELRAVA